MFIFLYKKIFEKNYTKKGVSYKRERDGAPNVFKTISIHCAYIFLKKRN